MGRKTIQGVVLCVAMALVAMADDGPAAPLSVSRQFPSQGTIRMRLTGGDYSIRASSTNEIRVTGTAEYPADPARLKAEVEIHGAAATIVTQGPHNNTHFTIEVPERTNLVIQLQAGDIEIRRIEGDLDIASHAGDVTVEVPRARDYRSVDASVYAGDLNAPAFGQSKSGLFRSLDGRGSIQAAGAPRRWRPEPEFSRIDSGYFPLSSCWPRYGPIPISLIECSCCSRKSACRSSS